MAGMAMTDFQKSSPGSCLGTCPDPECATGLAAPPGEAKVTEDPTEGSVESVEHHCGLGGNICVCFGGFS